MLCTKPFTIPPNNRLAGCHFAIRLRNCKIDILENLVAYLNKEICRRIIQNETKCETFRPKFNNQPWKLFIGHLSDVSNIQLSHYHCRCWALNEKCLHFSTWRKWLCALPLGSLAKKSAREQFARKFLRHARNFNEYSRGVEYQCSFTNSWWKSRFAKNSNRETFIK